MKFSEELKTKIKESHMGHLKALNAERDVNIYLYDNVLWTGKKLKALGKEIEVPSNTAFVLADLAPQFNWAHPCQWCLHNADTGELNERIDASLPPLQIIQNPESLELFHTPIKKIDTKARRANWKISTMPRLNVLSNYKGERYAILFSGSSNNRHVNDSQLPLPFVR